MEQYQAKWVNGIEIEPGVRECADRYEIIKQYASQFNRPFTVLDIGCNFGYFSFRLMEDFDCVSVMIESVPQYQSTLQDLARRNDSGIVLHHRCSQQSLELLSQVEHFDLVLAMSIVHHIPGDVNRTIEILGQLGDNVIIEVANEDNACGQEHVRTTRIGEDWKHIGKGRSHLRSGSERDIYAFTNDRRGFGSRYLGCPVGLKANHSIESDFDSKTISFSSRSESRDWIPGINLVTFRQYGGAYPSISMLTDTLESNELPSEIHGDIRPWNYILGHTLHLIDHADPDHNQITDDALSRDAVVRWLSSGSFNI